MYGMACLYIATVVIEESKGTYVTYLLPVPLHMDDCLTCLMSISSYLGASVGKIEGKLPANVEEKACSGIILCSGLV